MDFEEREMLERQTATNIILNDRANISKINETIKLR